MYPMQENKGRMSWKAFWLLLINPQAKVTMAGVEQRNIK